MIVINSTFSILSSQSPARLLFLNIKTKLVFFNMLQSFQNWGLKLQGVLSGIVGQREGLEAECSCNFISVDDRSTNNQRCPSVDYHKAKFS